MATIYMPLLDEGVDVWRPVEASPMSDGSYLIEGEMPDDEVWVFPPGSHVRCAYRMFDGGEGRLTAIGAAE